MPFADLNLTPSLLKALNDLGYVKPTTIQAKGFSVIMSGRDVVGIAQTGTGKTLAYLLPAIRQMEFTHDKKSPKMLIIVPTRELVAQVVAEAEKITSYMNVAVRGVYGGVNIKTHVEVIMNGVDILVATPGRLLDLLLNGTIKSKTIKKLVIDEVDEMLNLGFRTQLTTILDLLPPKRQNLMFSATLTDEVEALINEYFNTPEKIEAAPAGSPLENIEQSVYHVPNFYTKINLLELLLSNIHEYKKVLVFAATKKMADQLYDEMANLFPDEVGVIHSNKDQNNRFNTVHSFQDGTFRILIATDIIARGLDISEVSHVINFDVPEIPENYIHRIGRTGRADKKGNATTFVTEKETEILESAEELMNYKIPVKELPQDLEIATRLTYDEEPKVSEKAIRIKRPSRENVGPAFHEKKEKNLKENSRLSRADRNKMKKMRSKARRK